MLDPKAPKDAFGHELHVGDLVVLQPTGVPVYKVIHIQNGGLAVPGGDPRAVTPCLIRVISDITVGTAPGMSINNMVKVIGPGSEEALQRIIDGAPPTTQ
jgi:hypothetical protein